MRADICWGIAGLLETSPISPAYDQPSEAPHPDSSRCRSIIREGRNSLNKTHKFSPFNGDFVVGAVFFSIFKEFKPVVSFEFRILRN